MTPRTGVKPIPTAHYFAIMDRKPRVCIPQPANENSLCDEPGMGGAWGLLLMATVVFWITLALLVTR